MELAVGFLSLLKELISIFVDAGSHIILFLFDADPQTLGVSCLIAAAILYLLRGLLKEVWSSIKKVTPSISHPFLGVGALFTLVAFAKPLCYVLLAFGGAAVLVSTSSTVIGKDRDKDKQREEL